MRVLKGGLVIDGTGAPGVLADVGVAGGRIVAIAPGLAGDDEIDCAGLVVCPGFLDTHTHSDLAALRDPDVAMKARQGVTLDVLGQDGVSVAPLPRALRPQMERTLAGLDGTLDDWDWESVGEYLARLARTPTGIHLAYLVPHGNVRLACLGMDDRPATAAELDAMAGLLDESLDAGAIGMSTGLIYPPCCYAPTGELVALGRVLARHDRPLVAHVRSESDFLLDAIDELLRVGRESGCRVHVSHLKIAGRRNWPLVDRLVAALDSRDVRVTADQYPYTAGSTMMGAILPPRSHAGGFEATISRLGDAGERARMRADLLADPPHAWDNFWSWGGPEGIVISDVPSGRRPEWVGKSLAEVAGDRDPIEVAFDLLRDERMGVGMIAFSQSDDVVRALMAHPRVNGCTDGLLGGKPHPRAYGAFARMLRLNREHRIVPLPEMVRKLTSQAAEAMTLRGRGVLAPGAPADVVCFDAERVADVGTYAEPRRHPVGMPHVLVAGEPVVRDGLPTGARPGKVETGRANGPRDAENV
ncbi:MAG: N-acyl-D-amino-acid deacylase family protein [Myxococcota bacterium]